MEATTAKTGPNVFRHMDSQLGHIWLLVCGVADNLTFPVIQIHERVWWTHATYVSILSFILLSVC